MLLQRIIQISFWAPRKILKVIIGDGRQLEWYKRNTCAAIVQIILFGLFKFVMTLNKRKLCWKNPRKCVCDIK